MKKCISIITLMVLFLACKPIKEIEYRDSKIIEYRDRVRVDSVLNTFRDSIYINGDTVKIYRDRWRDRIAIKTDTVIVMRDVEHVKESVKIEHVGFLSWLKIFMYGAIFGAAVLLVVKYWIKITSIFKF